MSRLLAFLDAAFATESDECIDWPFGTQGRGYGWVEQRRACAHVLMCERVHGPRPGPKMQAAHTCGRPICVNPRHVLWKTATANAADMVTHGTRRSGERVSSARLTAADALAIRESRVSERKLAPLYGVSRSTIGDIRRRKSWNHI